MLGRDAPRDKLDHRLPVAAPIPGWSGFAIGRSIWQGALRAHLGRCCTAGAAWRRISSAYLDCASYYLRARDEMLTGPAGPEDW